MDYFTLFGLPVHYIVDGSLLTLRYQELQRQYHPDRFAASPEGEKLQALQQAATINEAYRTLKHPLKRAEYLLSLHGIDVRNEQQTMRDTQFLMEQLELREELDTISRRSDAMEALAAFATRIADMNKQRSQKLIVEFEQQQWDVAADTVRKLHFLDKLQQQIDNTEEKLLDS